MKSKTSKNNNWTLNNVGKFALLLLMLVGLPAGSWYYLKQGYQHRKTSLEELTPLGNVAEFSLHTSNGELFTLENIKDKTVIAAFANPDIPENKQMMAMIKKLHHQFDDQNKVLFLLHSEKDTTKLTDFYKQQQIEDKEQVILLYGTPTELQKLRKQYQLPSFSATQNIANNPYLTLVDTTTVLRHYDVNDNYQMGRLVEHITIVMPKPEKKDIYIDRESEK